MRKLNNNAYVEPMQAMTQSFLSALIIVIILFVTGFLQLPYEYENDGYVKTIDFLQTQEQKLNDVIKYNEFLEERIDFLEDQQWFIEYKNYKQLLNDIESSHNREQMYKDILYILSMVLLISVFVVTVYVQGKRIKKFEAANSELSGINSELKTDLEVLTLEKTRNENLKKKKPAKKRGRPKGSKNKPKVKKPNFVKATKKK